MLRLMALVAVVSTTVIPVHAADKPIRIATFHADVTPPLGAPLGFGHYGVAVEIVDRLSARGLVILSDQPPIVLCAVDWIGLKYSGHDEFRDALAKAAGTSRERVNVHCLHQHDAPGVDFAAEERAVAEGRGKTCDVVHSRAAIAATAKALADAVEKVPRNVTHVGAGKGRVEQVASNRRIIGPDGMSKAVRWSATKSAEIRAEPEGVIDPYVHLVSFWDGEQPLASVTYYATHPQSYYGQGGVSCDFPGLARGLRDADLPNVAHIHFNGAAGNITAGKYNDGDPANRPVLASRLAAGMKSAWDDVRKVPVTAANLDYRVETIVFPDAPGRLAGRKTDLSALRIGPAWILHMPGELFVEYQLAAQDLRPEETVCMAAYGDLAAGYIGTERAYLEGGYEPKNSNVTPAAEKVLLDAIRKLLK